MYTIACVPSSKNPSKISCPRPSSPHFPLGFSLIDAQQTGMFFPVLFRGSSLPICILLPAFLPQKIPRKALAPGRPLHTFRSAFPFLIHYGREHSFRCFSLIDAQQTETFFTAFPPCSYLFKLCCAFAERICKNTTKKRSKAPFHPQFSLFFSAAYFLSERWSLSLTSSSISLSRVLMSLN